MKRETFPTAAVSSSLGALLLGFAFPPSAKVICNFLTRKFHTLLPIPLEGGPHQSAEFWLLLGCDKINAVGDGAELTGMLERVGKSSVFST